MEHERNSNLIGFARKLRKDMTKEERHLWYDFLSKYPIRFRRQEIVENYILDFYCDKAKLAVELDGSQHYENEAERLHDASRTCRLRELGIDVIRFMNTDIHRSFEGVCIRIDEAVKFRIDHSDELFPECE